VPEDDEPPGRVHVHHLPPGVAAPVTVAGGRGAQPRTGRGMAERGLPLVNGDRFIHSRWVLIVFEGGWFQ
jgi:hypothetical protein